MDGNKEGRFSSFFRRRKKDEDIPPKPVVRRDNSKKNTLSAAQRNRLYETSPEPVPAKPWIAGTVLREGEVSGNEFSQQEAAVFNHVILNAVENLYKPEDPIGQDVNASEIGDILNDQGQALDRNFRKVVSNGPDYYLRMRTQALKKLNHQMDTDMPLEEVVGPHFENLNLAVTSISRGDFAQILQLVSERSPKEVLEEEFPRGVEEVDRLEDMADNLENPERTLRDEVEELVARFDSSRVYDIKSGIAIYVPFKIGVLAGTFDKRNFEKAEDLGIISSLGKNKLHQMDKFSRKDLIKLYWAVNHYNLRGLQKISPLQHIELREIGQIYDELMEARRKE